MDEKKAAVAAYRDHLNHEADLFKAIRGQEKRLLIKKEQEEKSKKRLEEKIIRNKLLLAQNENQKQKEDQIAENKAARRAKDEQEVRDKGWDKLDMSVQGMKVLPEHLYNSEESRIKYSYCELLDLSHNKLEKFHVDFMDILVSPNS